MNHSQYLSFVFFFLTAATRLVSVDCIRAAEQPNILFIAVDDLRPELGCYGSPIAQTPHLNELADRGLLFNRAYCQQAICRPSRASLMTGVRPETTGLFHNHVALRELQPDILTLPEHLIANGYDAAYVGKIFHNGDTDDGRSWSRDAAKQLGPNIKKPNGPYRLPENIQLRKKNFEQMFAKYGDAARRGLASGPAFEKADVPDHAYIDGYNTLLAIKTMREMAENNKPFFLAMGLNPPDCIWLQPLPDYNTWVKCASKKTDCGAVSWPHDQGFRLKNAQPSRQRRRP